MTLTLAKLHAARRLHRLLAQLNHRRRPKQPDQTSPETPQ